jgi:pimeloyl-ACP methyl ester carboxylesterase
MARIDVDGMGIDYEWLGDEGAPPLVLTPGGRYPRDTAGVPELGRIFADNGYRVLLWDRPGCGASDIAFTAITLMAAARDPGNVRKIAIWWISGGPVGLAGLAWFYCGDQIAAASKGGMEAVAALPSWADQIARNPRIRDILLAQDPDTYIDTMQKWGKAFAYSDDSPVPGMGPADFAKLTMPVLLFRSGKSDMAHTRRTSEWLHEMLPNVTFQEPPWGDQEWNYVSTFPIDPANRRGRFERWPLIAPPVLEFLKG